jgi:hypothetical protein
MEKRRLIVFLVIALAAIGAVVTGIILGDPAYMRMEASGL